MSQVVQGHLRDKIFQVAQRQRDSRKHENAELIIEAKFLHQPTSSPVNLFAIRGGRKRCPGTYQTCD